MILKRIDNTIFGAVQHQGEEDEIMELVAVRKEYLKNVKRSILEEELEFLFLMMADTPRLNDLLSHALVQMAKDTSAELTVRGSRIQNQIKFACEQGTDFLSKVVPTVIHESVTSTLIEKGYAYELSEDNPVIPSKPLLRVLNRLK